MLFENNDIADAKQKLLNKEILNKLRSLGYRPEDMKNENNATYVRLVPAKKHVKGSVAERIEINLRTGKAKFMFYMPNQTEYDEPYKRNIEIDKEVVDLCKQLKHSSQNNFRSEGKAPWGETLNRTKEDLKRSDEKMKKNPIYKKLLDKADNDIISARKRAAKVTTGEENKEAEEKVFDAVSKKFTLKNGPVSGMKKQALSKEMEKNYKIAKLNKGIKEETIDEALGYTPGYSTLSARSNAIKNKAVVGKLTKDEIVDKLMKIGFGDVRAKELANKWFEEGDKYKENERINQENERKMREWQKKQDEKYGEKPATKKVKKNDMADAFVKAWNKKNLGVKAIREEYLDY